MKRLFVLIAAAIAANTTPALAQEPTEVMVLGTYHFSGGGQDLHNADVGDSRDAEQQRQIAEVLDRIEAFRPTKIMVEARTERDDALNADYAAYLAGDYALANNETDQLGMALAARLDHERIYAVDFQNGMAFGAMQEAMQANGQERLAAQFQAHGQAIGELMARIQDGDVLDRLKATNSPEVDDLHDGYFILAQAGSPQDPVGAREMGAWWERNLIIFSNIAYHSEPGDRVLVIYGSGHKHLLDRFFDRAPGFTLVDPLDYLQ